MRRLRERFVSARRGDRGMTLAEMLVTMMVSSVLMIMVVSLLTSVTRSFTRERAATDSTRAASVAMKEITRVVRSGTEIPVTGKENLPVFLLATPDAVVLHSYIDTGSGSPSPIVVRFEVTATGDLVQKRWNAVAGSKPDWKFTGMPTPPYVTTSTYWTNPASNRTIARSLRTPAAGAAKVFTFLDENNAPVTPPVTGLMTKTQIESIAAVRVTVTVQTDKTGRAAPVVLTNTVGIPNLGISRVGA